MRQPLPEHARSIRTSRGVSTVNRTQPDDTIASGFAAGSSWKVTETADLVTAHETRKKEKRKLVLVSCDVKLLKYSIS